MKEASKVSRAKHIAATAKANDVSVVPHIEAEILELTDTLDFYTKLLAAVGIDGTIPTTKSELIAAGVLSAPVDKSEIKRELNEITKSMSADALARLVALAGDMVGELEHPTTEEYEDADSDDLSDVIDDMPDTEYSEDLSEDEEISSEDIIEEWDECDQDYEEA